jgi:putative phosphotransacetylase
MTLEKQLAELISVGLVKAGVVQVEASARHVHLSQNDARLLFGKNRSLTPQRYLSQTGEFLCKERVTLVSERKTLQNVAVLGPVRQCSQVELSLTDGASLGLELPVRDSGDIANTPGILLQTAFGEVKLSGGLIAARRHLHATSMDAHSLGISDKQLVSVEVFGNRRVVFNNVLVRVNDTFRLRVHLDMDEANAAGMDGFTLGKIVGRI